MLKAIKEKAIKYYENNTEKLQEQTNINNCIIKKRYKKEYGNKLI